MWPFLFSFFQCYFSTRSSLESDRDHASRVSADPRSGQRAAAGRRAQTRRRPRPAERGGVRSVHSSVLVFIGTTPGASHTTRRSQANAVGLRLKRAATIGDQPMSIPLLYVYNIMPRAACPPPAPPCVRICSESTVYDTHGRVAPDIHAARPTPVSCLHYFSPRASRYSDMSTWPLPSASSPSNLALSSASE